MRPKLLKEVYFVGLLLYADKKQRSALLQTISTRQLEAVIEIIFNILHGYGRLPDKDKKRLRRYQAVIRKFVGRRTPNARRKRILQKYFKVFYPMIKVIQNYIVLKWLDQ